MAPGSLPNQKRRRFCYEAPHFHSGSTIAAYVLLSNTCTAYAAENLTLKRTTVALGLGEKAACIQFNNSRIHPTDCTYRSADTSVLAVSKSGVVTAKKIGTAKVTVRYGRQTAACTVTVKAAPTKLAVKGGNVIIQKGANNHKIKLQFARGTAAYTVTYKPGILPLPQSLRKATLPAKPTAKPN